MAPRITVACMVAAVAMVVAAAMTVVWFIAGPPVNLSTIWTAKDTYNPTARIILPIEAFGANWRVQNFRKKVPFPENFDAAMQRAMDASTEIEKTNPLPVYVTLAPRTWHLKSTINIPDGITLQGAGTRIKFD